LDETTSILIDGREPQRLAREPYDLRRSPEACGTACHAPFRALHVSATGTVSPCPYSRIVLADLRRQTLAEAFTGGAAQEVRDRFRDYRVSREECEPCIALWIEGAYSESPAVHEFDPLAASPGSASAPRRLGIDVDFELDRAAAEQILEWLPQLSVLEIAGTDPLRNATVLPWLAALRGLAPERRPRLHAVFKNQLIDEGTIEELVSTVKLCALRPAAIESLLEDSRFADTVRALRRRSIEVRVEFAVGRRDWLALYPWMKLSRDLDFVLEPELVPADDPTSLYVDAETLSAVCTVVYQWCRDARSSWGCERLLHRLRRWQKEIVSHGLAPDGLLDIELPFLDHPLWHDPKDSLRFLCCFLRVYHHPVIERWLHAITVDPRFVGLARERVDLRIAALWLARVFERIECFDLLREIYQDPESAVVLVERDLDTVRGSELEDWVQSWVSALRLDHLPLRRRTFPVRERRPAPRKRTAPAVSVIVPSYNHAGFVERCIQSVLAQTDPGFELVIVDDASTDDTFERASRFKDPRIRVERNPTNLGLGQSLKSVLPRVRSPIVAILNSDDLFHPRRLQSCLRAFAESQDTQVVATSLLPIDASDKVSSALDSSPVFDGKKIHDWLNWYAQARVGRVAPDKLLGKLLEGNFLITTSNLVVRRPFLERLVPRWEKLEYCVDWMIFLTAALEGSLKYVPWPLLGYRLHLSNTVWFDRERKWRYWVEVNQVIAHFLERLFDRWKEKGAPSQTARTVLQQISLHLRANRSIDWRGVELGHVLDRLGLCARDFKDESDFKLLRQLSESHEEAVAAEFLAREFKGRAGELYRWQGEIPHLRTARIQRDLLADERDRIQGELHGAFRDRAEETRWKLHFEDLWKSAEGLRTKTEAERDEEARWKLHFEQLFRRTESERDAEMAVKEQATRELEQTRKERDTLIEEVLKLEKECDEIIDTLEIQHTELDQVSEQSRLHLLALQDKVARVEERLKGQAADLASKEAVERERDDLLGQIERLTLEHEGTIGSVREAARLELDGLQRKVADVEARLERQDADLAAKSAIVHERDELLREIARQEREYAERMGTLEEERERSRLHLDTVHRKIAEIEAESEKLKKLLAARTGERDQALRSPEFRFGQLVLHRLKLRWPLRMIELASALARHRLCLWRGRLDRLAHALQKKRPFRAIATACWNFPIYSQTFVYQELIQLIARGFDLKFMYSKLDSKDYLHARFRQLWGRKRRLILDRAVQKRDYEHFRRRMPRKLDNLVQRISEHSGLGEEQVRQHDNFLQGLSFARMVEAYRPHYLHSYFFYDRSFMTLVAAELLDVPRGISCYADHRLNDYEFKLVRLHLELCRVVVATSARIKSELLDVAPGIDADRIIVKPNAIDSRYFQYLERAEPADGRSWRLVCVSRIEPKKGLTHLVRAVHLLKERGLAVELHQVGEADQGIQSSLDYKVELDQLITQLGLWGRVHLEGRQNQQGVQRFLGISQLFVAPFVETESGDKDGIPTALLEAMATGLPAVATNSGSIEEVIDSGVDGLIVPQREPGALADAIESLLLNRERRRELGRRAREKVLSRYDVLVCEKLLHERVLALVQARSGK